MTNIIAVDLIRGKLICQLKNVVGMTDTKYQLKAKRWLI